MKKKTLNEKDIAQIFELIKRQRYLAVREDKEMDPKGLMVFTNEVACRNIRDSIYRYLEEVMDEDSIPYEYQERLDLNDNGIKKYREENQLDCFPVD
jgi:hypothetical protein